MASRDLLHFSRADDFCTYMEDMGYQSVEPKGEYEVFRFVHPRLSGKYKVVVIYKKDGATEHYTVQDKDVQLIKDFIRDFRK